MRKDAECCVKYGTNSASRFAAGAFLCRAFRDGGLESFGLGFDSFFFFFTISQDASSAAFSRAFRSARSIEADQGPRTP